MNDWPVDELQLVGWKDPWPVGPKNPISPACSLLWRPRAAAWELLQPQEVFVNHHHRKVCKEKGTAVSEPVREELWTHLQGRHATWYTLQWRVAAESLRLNFEQQQEGKRSINWAPPNRCLAVAWYHISKQRASTKWLDLLWHPSISTL